MPGAKAKAMEEASFEDKSDERLIEVSGLEGSSRP